MMMMLPMMMLAGPACQTAREVTLPNGARYADGGHFAGDTLVMMEPDGSVILRNKMNKPWADFLQAAAFMFGADKAAEVAVANIARKQATSLAAQRAATVEARSAAELESLRIATDLEKFRLLNPVPAQLPVLP